MVASIVIVIEPSKLDNPDTDLRLVLPALIVGRSQGALRNDGWGYDESGRMHLFFSSDSLPKSAEVILEFIQSEQVLGNDLRTVYVGVREEVGFRPIYPPGVSEMIPDIASGEA